jgi:AsmA protein
VPPPPRIAQTAHPEFDEDDSDGGRPWGKILGLSALGAIVLAGAAAAALMVYTPVDLVRDRLVREVKAKTGRDLVIGAKPNVSFWPNLAVSLGNVSLSNPPGMSGPPLITMQRLDATIQLWPLLQRRVQVDQLVLQSPRIALTVDGQGRRNWDFATLLDTAPRRVQFAQVGPIDLEQLPEDLRDFAKGASRYKSAAATGSDGISLGRVRVIDGALRHFDERTGIVEEATAIDLTVDAPDLAGPLQAAGTLTWRGEAVRLDTRVMPAKALLASAPAQTTAAIGSGPLHLTYAGTVTPGQGGVKLDGAVTAKSPALAKAAQWLGRPLTGEPANGPMTFKGRVSLNGPRAGFSDATLQVPGLNLTGALALDTGGARPKLSGQIRLAELNLEAVSKLRLMEPVAQPRTSPRAPAPPQSIEDLLKAQANPSAPAAPATPVAPVGPAAKPQAGSVARGDGWSEGPLDLSALALADADLKIAFNRLGGDLAGAGPGHITIALTDRVAKLTFDDVTLHDGKVRGTIALDGAAQRPTTAINLVMDGVSLQPLLKEFGTEGLDGKARVTLALSGTGRTERQLIDSLSGKAEMLVPRGAFLGIDLGQMMQALPRGQLPRFEKTAGARTDFTDLGASFTIARGIADNRDFRVVTRDVRAIGNGQIALGARTIDATVRPKLLSGVQTPAGAGGPGINLAGIDLPIRIVGPLDKPAVSADFGNILRNPGEAVEALKQLDKGEVQDTVKGVIAGDEAAKKKAHDFLNNLLKR